MIRRFFRSVDNWGNANFLKIMQFMRHTLELMGVGCLFMWMLSEAFYMSDLTSLVAAIACGVSALVIGMEAKEL